MSAEPVVNTVNSVSNSISSSFSVVAQLTLGLVTGSVIDHVFKQQKSLFEKDGKNDRTEELITDLVMLTGQTIVVGGVLIPIMDLIPAKDPTNGVFSIVPIFLSMPNYQQRILRIVGQIQKQLYLLYNEILY
jgi:hypothetical protein